ncbi:hypothetical protein M8J76_010543 [Diaphorina citri]|nr:hypothetical protein M8J75_006998 [Diaphorina citri]KAI5726896.1 hypothetical protein M8J76_010543 [Diaphorina citri]KAI5732165.1 hypothetical protein M8J77_022546 [Diaphorina citri]
MKSRDGRTFVDPVKIYSSKKTQTGEKTGSPPRVIRPKCAIPLDYAKVIDYSEIRLFGQLSKPYVRDCVRLYLAYFSNHRDTIIDGWSYIKALEGIQDSGLPTDTEKLMTLYLRYQTSRGTAEKDVRMHLEATKDHFRYRQLAINRARRRGHHEPPCGPICTIL